MRRLLLALIFCTVSASYGYNRDDASKTITSDGSLADTQAAVNYVRDRGQDGWVLTVGAAGGNYTWTAALTVDVSNHIFTLQGASAANRPSISSTYTGDCG